MQRNLYKRILLGILFPAFIAIGCLCAMSETLILSCRFHDLTGLYCPGCGSGRAVAATLRGDFREAFRWNPMVYLLGVPSMAILGYEYVRVVFGVRRLKPVMMSERLVSSVTVLVIVFWVLRNIPFFSFLAPR